MSATPTTAAPLPAPAGRESGATPWGALLASALVGTARRPPPPPGALALALGLGPGPGPGIGYGGGGPGAGIDVGGGGGLTAGIDLDRGDSAAALLAAAAVLSACTRAGRRAGEAPRRLPTPAGPDTRPVCSGTAVEVLELILSGEVPIPGGAALLAGEWLDGAARAGCRVPARLLPRLLELGSAATDLRPVLHDVLGPRGRWLAGHHDRWAWAAPEPIDVGEPSGRGAPAPVGAPTDRAAPADHGEPVDSGGPADDRASADGAQPLERRFATAGRAERPVLLEAVRRADPARGRDLLGSTWAGDPAADRAALLAVLAVGLSDDDEPFLEAALDDRAAAVRQVAAELLGRLPASRRAARMADRLRPLVAVDGDPDRVPSGGRGRPEPAFHSARPRNSGTPLRGRTLSAGRAPEPDAAARRDGVADAAPAGMGVSAWRLVQLVAGAPLSFWAEHLGLGPAEVVELAADGAPDVLTGLERAVAAQAGRADPAWAQAVFAHRPTPAVLAALPAELAAGELTRLLAGGLAPRPAVAELFAACPRPWPEPLADAVLDRYRQLGAKATLELPAALPVLATRLDPSALPLVETWVVTLAGDPGLRRRVQTLGHALSLRAVIHREFP